MSNPGEQLTWQPGVATLHGKPTPRSTATAPDMRTAIEIIGTPDRVKQISVVGECVDEATARQAATYMVMTVRLILPRWTGANTWLTNAYRDVRKRPQSITMQGWKLRMEWLESTTTVTLKATR